MTAPKKRCLITAGPTREYFDPVRFISNPSSGKMGYALAQEAVQAGWEVTLISGPVSLPAPKGATLFSIQSAHDLLKVCQREFENHDLLIMTAAVCDMRPKEFSKKKQKKNALSMTIEMEPVPDVLHTLSQSKKPGQTLVGFAAETDHVLEHAQEKLDRKNLDWIVANQVGGENSAFESDQNTVTLIGADRRQFSFGPAPKAEIARSLVKQLQALIR